MRAPLITEKKSPKHAPSLICGAIFQVVPLIVGFTLLLFAFSFAFQHVQNHGHDVVNELAVSSTEPEYFPPIEELIKTLQEEEDADVPVGQRRPGRPFKGKGKYRRKFKRRRKRRRKRIIDKVNARTALICEQTNELRKAAKKHAEEGHKKLMAMQDKHDWELKNHISLQKVSDETEVGAGVCNCRGRRSDLDKAKKNYRACRRKNRELKSVLWKSAIDSANDIMEINYKN